MTSTALALGLGRVAVAAGGPCSEDWRWVKRAALEGE